MSKLTGPFRTTGWGPFAFPWERKLLRRLQAERVLFETEEAINEIHRRTLQSDVRTGAEPQVHEPQTGTASASQSKPSTRATATLVALVVDNDQVSRDELGRLLRQDVRISLTLEAEDAEEALQLIIEHAEQVHIDIVFLETQMEGIDGIELAREISSMAMRPSIVFVTADDNRAVEAYELGAVNYMLKDLLSADRLAATIDRILERVATAANAEVGSNETNSMEVIPVEVAGTTKLVPLSSVRYVEAQGDYARLHTNEGSHLVRIPLSVLEDRWRDAGFVRIHRSFLVSLQLVSELQLSGSGYVVRVGSGPETAELPVSRRHTRELKDRLIAARERSTDTDPIEVD